MRNAIRAAIVLACFAAVDRINAAEKVYMAVSYSPAEAFMVVNDIGQLPKHSFVGEESKLVWAVFKADDPRAEDYVRYSNDAYVIAESKFPELRTLCLTSTVSGSLEQKSCLSDFEKLASVIHE